MGGAFSSGMDYLSRAKAAAQTAAKKYMNNTVMEATVAGCALVANADGMIDATEKRKMLAVLSADENLKVFKPEDIHAQFETYLKKWDIDPTVGEASAYNALRKLKKGGDEANLVIALMIAIGGADANFDDKEKAVVRTAAKELNVDVSVFGL